MYSLLVGVTILAAIIGMLYIIPRLARFLPYILLIVVLVFCYVIGSIIIASLS